MKNVLARLEARVTELERVVRTLHLPRVTTETPVRGVQHPDPDGESAARLLRAIEEREAAVKDSAAKLKQAREQFKGARAFE